MQLRPRIHLYFGDGRYVAIVPDHPGRHAHGASYAQALGNLELLPGRRFEHGTEGRSEAGGRCNSSAIRARLVARFGRLSNRRLAASIGIVAPDAPVMLSSALGGKGSRQVIPIPWHVMTWDWYKVRDCIGIERTAVAAVAGGRRADQNHGRQLLSRCPARHA